jgi:DNA topoisomerase III
MKILCVAEKPSIAKAVAQILGGGHVNTSATTVTYIKNYRFSARIADWGDCDVTFTSVAGHLTENDFDEQYKKWTQCSPVALFDARIVEKTPQVLAK